MAKKSRVEQEPEPKPDLTPMIDIVFNLIIFFMIVSELSKEAGLKWRNLTPEERKFFEEKGKAVKEEYYKIKAMTTEERIAYLEIDKDPYAKFF